jgi:hypothetical protein
MNRGGITALALLSIVCAVAGGWFLDWYSQQLQDITEMHLAMQHQHPGRNHCDEIWTFHGTLIGTSSRGYALLTRVNDAPNAGVFIVARPSSQLPEVGTRLEVKARPRCVLPSDGIDGFSEISRSIVSP